MRDPKIYFRVSSPEKFLGPTYFMSPGCFHKSPVQYKSAGYFQGSRVLLIVAGLIFMSTGKEINIRETDKRESISSSRKTKISIFASKTIDNHIELSQQ